MKPTKRELATVPAALRYWQREGLWGDPIRELNIATDGGEIEPLSHSEIDDLCERLNFGELEEAVNAHVLDSLKECSSLLEAFSPRHELNTAVMRAKTVITEAESRPAPKLTAKEQDINSEMLEALKLAVPELKAWSNSKSFHDLHGDPDEDYSKALRVAAAVIAKAEGANQRATPKEITKARELYAREGEIEIDDNARASRGDEDGVYVEGWLWVPND